MVFSRGPLFELSHRALGRRPEECTILRVRLRLDRCKSAGESGQWGQCQVRRDRSETPCPQRVLLPAGSFSANSFDRYDMHCNVQEWGEDVWSNNCVGPPENPLAWTALTWMRASEQARHGFMQMRSGPIFVFFRLDFSISNNSISSSANGQ